MSKCNICNKKINILDSVVCKCRCGHTFCQKHKFVIINDYNTEFGHNCSFDYKQL